MTLLGSLLLPLSPLLEPTDFDPLLYLAEVRDKSSLSFRPPSLSLANLSFLVSFTDIDLRDTTEEDLVRYFPESECSSFSRHLLPSSRSFLDSLDSIDFDLLRYLDDAEVRSSALLSLLCSLFSPAVIFDNLPFSEFFDPLLSESFIRFLFSSRRSPLLLLSPPSSSYILSLPSEPALLFLLPPNNFRSGMFVGTKGMIPLASNVQRPLMND